MTDPGKGGGSRLIRAVTALADVCGAALYLNPWALANRDNRAQLSQDSLEAWYIRHGWVWTEENDHVMVREPSPAT